MNISEMRSLYSEAESAKVGTQIACACGCGKKLIKKSYQQKFLSTKHKDRYWNTVDEGRRERARIHNGTEKTYQDKVNERAYDRSAAGSILLYLEAKEREAEARGFD